MPPEKPPVETGNVTELASLLWQVRELLQRVLDPAAEPGRRDAALQDLLAVEVLRAVRADALAAGTGLPAGVPLSRLVRAVDEPWSTILAEHEHALRALLTDLARAGGPRLVSLLDFLG
jgi:hypothetical protein